MNLEGAKSKITCESKLRAEMDANKLKAAIGYATANRDKLKISKYAACYYCKQIYPASEVVEFCDSETTALCPKCGIDSVLSDQSPYEFKIEVLEELNQFWF